MGLFNKTEPIQDVDNYCLIGGILIIVLGLIHLFLSGILDPTWGVLLIILGIIAISYRSKVMILVFGVALIIVGILNISILVYEVSIFWLLFGILQIGWGVGEIRKYHITKENPKHDIKGKKTKGFTWYALRVLVYGGIIFYIFELFLDLDALSINSIYSLIFFGLVLFGGLFIISIIHLKTYKRKGLAMFGLIFSIAYVLFTLIGFTSGLLI